MRKRIAHLLGLSLALLFLSSCFVPEKFSASLSLDKNGSYTFMYDGILVYALARQAYVQGQLNAKGDAELRTLEKKLRTESPAFKQVKYLGAGRYQVLYEVKGNLEKPFYFFGSDNQLFSARKMKIKGQQGVFAEIKGFQVDAKGLKEFQALHIDLDGKLKVDTDRPVVKSNATGTPHLFGLLSGYTWEIKSAVDPAPYMLVRLQ